MSERELTEREMAIERKSKMAKLPPPLAEFIGVKLDRVNVVHAHTSSLYTGYESVAFYFSNGKSMRLDVKTLVGIPAIRLSKGSWERIKATPAKESKVDESKTPNNMRCCNCGLRKKPWEIVCDCCGGTTYEGFYDKELDECVDEGKPEVIGVKVSLDGVEDIRVEKPVEDISEPIERTMEERMSGVDVSSSKYVLDMRGNFDSIKDIDEYRRRNPGANGEVYTMSGHLVNEDVARALEDTEAEKSVEDMTIKELVESEPDSDLPSICDLPSDDDLPSIKDIMTKDPETGVITLDRPNPVAHVCSERILHHNGVFCYRANGGNIILDTVVFRRSHVNNPEVILGICDKEGKILPELVLPDFTGRVTPEGTYVFNSKGVDFDRDVISVSYDYEYPLPGEREKE